MEAQLVTQQIDPILMDRMAVRARQMKVKQMCVEVLEQRPYFFTRKMLYEVAIQRGIIDINNYSKFMRDLADLIEDKEIPEDLIKYDKKPERTPDLFENSHLRKIMKRIYELKKPSLAVAFLLGYRQCLRLGEVVRLRWTDISFERNEMIIRDSKWKHRSQTRRGEGKTAPIPMMDDVAEILKKYKQYCEVTKDTQYLFPSPKNPNRCIMPKTLFERFASVLRDVGLRSKEQVLYEYKESRGKNSNVKKNKYRYYFHTLRHCGAMYWLHKTGGNKDLIKALLRHEESETTEIYCRMATSELKRVFENSERNKYHQLKAQLATEEQQELLRRIMKQETNKEADMLVEKHKLRNEELDKMNALKEKELEILRLQSKIRVENAPAY